MEAIAGITAIGSLASGFLQVCKLVRRMIRTIRFAKKEMQKLRTELSLFSDLLERFSQCLTEASDVDNDLLDSIRAANIGSKIVRMANNALKEVKTLLHSVDPLCKDCDCSYFEQATALIHWTRRKSKLPLLFLDFNTVRTSAELLLSTISVECLLKALKKLTVDNTSQREKLLEKL